MQAVLDLKEKVGGLGGVVALSSDGIGIAFNTPRMAFAYQLKDQDKPIVGIEKNDMLYFKRSKL